MKQDNGMSAWEKIKYAFGWRPEGPDVPNPLPLPPKSPALVPISTPVDSLARTLGVDVAKYQDKMDASEWKKLWELGYRFCIAKCTDGNTGKDSFYQLHRRLSKAQGFLFSPYHFHRFGYSPKEQAEHFFKNSGHITGDLPPMLDVEWDHYTLNQKYGDKKRMDDWAADHVYEALMHIERLFGVIPWLYTNAYFWPEKVNNAERFTRYKLVVPSYADSLKPSGKNVKMPYPWKLWTIWQDSDDLKVGDTTAIDTDVYRGSLEELRHYVKR